MLSFISQLAKEAGRICIAATQPENSFSVELKNGPRDPVTSVDRRVENFLRQEILYHYPDHAIIGEEGGRSEDTSGWNWVLDPIDGTVSFMRGQPGYSISIACRYGKKTMAAAVYAPVMAQLFTAERDKGAWLNGDRIQVSQCTEMSEAVLGTGFACMREKLIPNNLSVISKIMPEIVDIRRIGSAALDLAYVAAGRYDGFWERRLKVWDIAAGIIIVKEAGGLLEPMDPEGDELADGALIAANEAVFSTFAKVIRNT